MSTRRANGEGSKPRKRPDGRYEAKIRVEYADGERKRLTVYGETANECRDKMLEIRRDAADQRLIKRDPATVATFLERWLDDVVAPARKPNTVRSYRGVIKSVLAPAIGATRLQQLSPSQVQHAIAGLPGARGARNRELAYIVLHAALDRALKWGMVSRNVCDAVEKPSVRKRDMMFFTPDDVTAFLEASKDLRLRTLFWTLLFTGIRPGEAYALDWAQVDLDGKKLTITHTLDARTLTREDVKTRTGRRTIDIGTRLVAEFRAHRERMLAEGHPRGLVFATRDGEPLHESNVTRQQYFPIFERMQQAENRAAAAAHRKPRTIQRIRMYDLRHTAATLMIAAGTHVKVISERMGHASVAFTMDVYGHLLPTLGAEAATALEQYLPIVASGE